jgi:chorismate-pyruvate lyase
MIRAASLFLLIVSVPANAQDALARLKADLAKGPSATEVLTRWCGAAHLADPPQVHAEQVREPHPAGPTERALLKVSENEPVAYRRVRLTCGGHVLSEADNWYVPSRLTADMKHTLNTGDTPFGTLVKPLNFHRVTLKAASLSEGRTVFQVKAVLLTPDGKPISLVVENYQQDLLGR